MNNIDFLCNQLSYSNIEYDEYQELTTALTNSMTNKYNENNTIERYQRYIKFITIWEINGKSFEYIKELILEFLNNNNINKVKYSVKIDTELITMLT